MRRGRSKYKAAALAFILVAALTGLVVALAIGLGAGSVPSRPIVQVAPSDPRDTSSPSDAGALETPVQIGQQAGDGFKCHK